MPIAPRTVSLVTRPLRHGTVGSQSGSASASEQEDGRHRRRRFDNPFEDEAGVDERIEIGRQRSVRRTDPDTYTIGIVVG